MRYDFWPILSAAIRVVPDPPKASMTPSAHCVLSSSFSSISTGFCVGWSSFPERVASITFP